MALDTTSEDGERPRLSKTTVIDHALKLADTEGLQGLTIRKLAAQLGVTPMALYWHFRSKEDLFAGLAERIWGEIDTNVDPVAPWSARLRKLLESLVSVLAGHPCAPRLLIQHESKNEAALRATEVTLGVLRDGGFDATMSSEIARQALWTGITLVLGQIGGLDPSTSPADREEHLRQDRIRYAMLPPDRYPLIVESAEPLTDCDRADFHYETGISVFIGGVEVLARRYSG
jgi:TetR/AcrR family transcriptional regulator, tetracycline repressor protein